MKKIFLLSAILLAVNTLTAQTGPTPQEAAETYVNQGLEKASGGDWTSAIGAYNNALAQNPNSAAAYYNRGIARYNLKDYRGAMMDYSKAIRADGNDNTIAGSGSYYGRGMCFYMLGMKEKACPEFSKAVELGYPDASTALQNYCN